MPPKLGIMAGGGLLPILIDQHCARTGRDRFVVAFSGHADPVDFAASPHAVNRLGAAGRTIKLLKSAGCGEVVLVGNIRRPGFVQLLPDGWAIRFLVTTGAFGKGDDGLLSALIGAIEAEGLRVVGVDQLLPELVTPLGVLGQMQPTDVDRRDIDAAIAAARAIGIADKGQAAVAQNGAVIAREDKSGTDAMLNRIPLRDPGQPGGVLAKTMKPGQERRADLPAIGPETVTKAHRAGLAGIAAEAGNSLILDRSQTIAEADRLGLFVIGVEVTE
ncbi:MAG: UDP-2,3-diacylglucosamine diphosphatase LpxI [Proteobacteria bacterium]|nr:UDP-2,3-diacylglucosamine diphosphatase LpxI [Pseudomonadota bacterium]